jgi:hypothetical protein
MKTELSFNIGILKFKNKPLKVVSNAFSRARDLDTGSWRGVEVEFKIILKHKFQLIFDDMDEVRCWCLVL